jgi:hypothetical protein
MCGVVADGELHEDAINLRKLVRSRTEGGEANPRKQRALESHLTILAKSFVLFSHHRKKLHVSEQ